MVRSYPDIHCNILLRVSLGKSVDLPPESEEVAGFYAALIESEHAQDKTFNENFMKDWKVVLKKFPPVRCLSIPERL